MWTASGGDNGLYNAFVRIDEAGALAEARAADQRLQAARRRGPAAPYLCGIPMGFKDSIGTRGFKQQNGTVAFAGNVALADSTPGAAARAGGRRARQHHRARPADPAPRSQALRRGATREIDDPTLSNDPLVHEVHVA